MDPDDTQPCPPPSFRFADGDASWHVRPPSDDPVVLADWSGFASDDLDE